MTTSIYLITSITQSGGSDNYDYVIDTATFYDGTFSAGSGATTDGDNLFEDGEVFFYTVNGTAYTVAYDGFVDINATSSVDFGVLTVTGVVSGPDSDGLVGSQFAFTPDASVPAEANRAKLPDPAVGTQISGWVCFASGTLIKTAFGDVPVEKLKVGDLVETQDDGPQKIRWTGSRRLALTRGIVTGGTPVRIRAHAFGLSMPTSDLIVSQQHRILIQGAGAELLFGEPEVLVPAKHLVNGTDVTFATELAAVEYVHIMFEDHQIVTSNGVSSESFHPDTVGLGNIDRDAREEMFGIFPELRSDTSTYGPTARLTIRAHQAAVLMELNAANRMRPAHHA